jgi:hypothetical protein
VLRCSDTTYATKRQAVAALLDLVTGTKSNLELFTNIASAPDALFGMTLPTCGDCATQVRHLWHAASSLWQTYAILGWRNWFFG